MEKGCWTPPKCLAERSLIKKKQLQTYITFKKGKNISEGRTKTGKVELRAMNVFLGFET